MGIDQIRELKKVAFYKKEYPEEVKKKAIAKVSEKGKDKLLDKKIIQAQDKVFYMEVWAAVPHSCEACKVKLPKEPLTIFFHHALPKRTFPQFRHESANIIILCPDCHTQVETDIDKIPYVKKKTEKIRKELLG